METKGLVVFRFNGTLDKAQYERISAALVTACDQAGLASVVFDRGSRWSVELVTPPRHVPVRPRPITPDPGARY